MEETLTERRRVDDEGRKIVKSFYLCGISFVGNDRMMTVADE